MLKFNEQEEVTRTANTLKLRTKVEETVDHVCAQGYNGAYFMGIGGTYASCLQTVNHAKSVSNLPIYAENAAEYLTTGNKRINDKSLVVIASVTGNTPEMVNAVKKAKKCGAYVIGFVEDEKSELASLVDAEFACRDYEQLKFFMVADRLMKNNNEFQDYDKYYSQLDQYLPQGLADIQKAADDFGLEYARKHYNDSIHYFVGAGNLWGATYSYAMCYCEEEHWMRTKSIHAAEFFHGTLEIIDRDTPVTLFLGEDAERSLAERVAKFLPRVCANCTFIDTMDYSINGIDKKYRGAISPFIMHAVTQRIDAHLEQISCHPMEIRRYYRQLKY